ncbi:MULTISPECIES: LysR family transcriptional regulator [Lactiplantibacillus]|uniref:LysR family transcriptional regulator n=1 Tax=Lactiplantibacillus plantarum 2025 TaxID=1385856 RepID=A0A837NNW6_LACPN|nr:LysR family transcriptional regulator [Lactiplantibacillus plantarum]KAF1284658.1 LysR family transcriptional regulator [Lactiplantibacillus plantarum]MBT9654824.1 LysR family transcriptional regulator [Lactiplantibacillus plantarum]MBU7443587.1 LysR family transcriptional regulator [Lactiplantibacillus plantarum]MBU7456739.1 LysR family transcriptional regulator [Lactiplantibacillus plantarum]MBU7466212.1 LysR family transcriptional regulator [Lactiplantibacillus plantarum]
MNIKDLYYFQRLISTQSYTQTAADFHVSQPTISQAIKRLERHFQVTLFFRQAKTKALVLTPSGQQLLLAANDIINNWQHVNESISHLRQHTLRFGIEPSVSEHYLPALTKPIIEQDLLSSVHTVEMGANQLVKQVLAGQLDLAISGNLDQTLDERLAVTPLRPFKFRILANAAHPLAKAEHPTFAEALKSPFVLLNATYLNKLVFRQLAEQLSIEPQVLFESDSSTLIKGLVKENLALGFISDITTPNDGLVEIPFDDVQVPSVHINLIRRAHQFPIGLVKQVIDIIEKTFAADNAEQKS